MSSTPQHEPTMEEILASIRKIISEDAPESANEDAPAAPASTQQADDVLELTQEVAAPAPAPVFAPEPRTENDVVFQTIEEPVVSNNPPPDNNIFSDHTRKALDDVFASIPQDSMAQAPMPHPAAPLAPIDGATVENVFERAVRESFDPVLHQYLDSNAEAVIERMKPMIREWMDEHFPALLEGAVRAEVERVIKARGKR